MWLRVFMRIQGEIENNTHIHKGARQTNEFCNDTKGSTFEVDENGRIVVEWRVLATALDRFFFIIYSLCMVVSWIALFPR